MEDVTQSTLKDLSGSRIMVMEARDEAPESLAGSGKQTRISIYEAVLICLFAPTDSLPEDPVSGLSLDNRPAQFHGLGVSFAVREFPERVYVFPLGVQ